MIIIQNMIQDVKNWSEILVNRVSNKSGVPKYQLLLFTNFGLKWLLAGMILFSLNFFYITPDFECDKTKFPDSQKCQEYVCSLDESLWHQYFKKPVPQSIALDYGIMLCHNAWLSSLLQSMSYIGSFVGYIIMSHIADNFGRKKAESASWMICVLGITLLVFSQSNLVLVGIGSFLMGGGANAAITLHYTLIKQFLVGKMRQRSFLILQVLFSIGVSLIALLSMYILNWKLIAGLFLLIPSILILPFSFYIIEQTPNFNIRKGKSILLNSLNRIAEFNKTDELLMQDLDFIPEVDHMAISKNNGTEYTLIDLFKYRSLRYITMFTGAMNCIIQFIYDGTILSLDKIGINVYLDQILVGFVEIFASIFCSYVIVKMKRKKFMRICLVLIGVFTCLIGILTLMFKHETNTINGHVILEMIFLAGLRFVINNMWGLFFVYVSELFPSNVLSLAFGWVSAIGTVGAFSSPFIRLLTANATMFVMTILCVVSLFLIQDLSETKDKRAVQEIQERTAAEEKYKKSMVSENNV